MTGTGNTLEYLDYHGTAGLSRDGRERGQNDVTGCRAAADVLIGRVSALLEHDGGTD